MFEPDDEKPIRFGEVCRDPKHYPPTLMYFGCSGWWVCPNCGHRTRIIGPPTCTMAVGKQIK